VNPVAPSLQIDDRQGGWSGIIFDAASTERSEGDAVAVDVRGFGSPSPDPRLAGTRGAPPPRPAC
jgi:hypothetical protein